MQFQSLNFLFPKLWIVFFIIYFDLFKIRNKLSKSKQSKTTKILH